MKKTSNYLLRMLFVVAFVGFAGTVSAQSAVNAGGSSSDEWTCSIGDAVVGDTEGFINALLGSPVVPTSVKTVFAADDVNIQSHGNGTVVIGLDEKVLAEGAYYCIYNTVGAMLSKTEITSVQTTVDASSAMSGKPVIILVGTEKSGKLTSVKLVK